jgi:hypothetical protein
MGTGKLISYFQVPMSTAASLAAVVESLAGSTPTDPSSTVPASAASAAPPLPPSADHDVAWLNINELNPAVESDDDDDVASVDINELTAAESDELEKCVNTCVERWKNAGPEARKKMFALFAIAGIFISVCRHGHVLIMCDMIRSGEL